MGLDFGIDISDKVILINGEEWFTSFQLCRDLDISMKTIYLWLKRGKIEKTQVDKHSFYRLKA